MRFDDVDLYAIRILYTVIRCYVRSGSYQKVLCTTPKQNNGTRRGFQSVVTSTAFFEDIVFTLQLLKKGLTQV